MAAVSERRVRTVFIVDERAVAEGIPRGLLGAPFIVDEAGDFDARVNEYLWARRNGDWSPASPVSGKDVEAHGRAAFRAKLNYLRDRAYQLDVFRRWLGSKGLDYRAVDQSVLDRFAEDLEDGVGENEQGLQPSSVNHYLLSAVDYLNFGAHRSWWRQLRLGRSKAVWRPRNGNVSVKPELHITRRANPAEIEVWYDEDQIEAFFDEFDTAPAALAARIIHRMGLRNAEVLSLSETSFPTLAEFRADRARRKIYVLGKFSKLRPVPVDEAIVRAVEQFKSFDRKPYEKRLGVPTDKLLICDSDGGKTAPMKARNLQKQFVQARHAAGYSALSPHLLRHHFAVHFLTRSWRQKARLFNIHHQTFNVGAAKGLLSSELLSLQRALGHRSFDTTAQYLHGVSYLMGSDLPEQYSAELDGEAE